MCVFLFCLRRLYENDGREIKACKPTNMGEGDKEKYLMVGKFQTVLGGNEQWSNGSRHHRAVKGKTRKPRQGCDYVKYVPCGQDRRLLFWETGLTHCVCPWAETPKNALASFLPTEQGPLCLTSLASTLEAAGELIAV